MIRFQTMVAVYGACASVGLACVVQQASPDPAPAPAVASMIPYLVADADGVKCVVIRFKIQPKWHVYWSNPGDNGSAPTVKLSLPAGWTRGQMEFPRPQVLGNAEERNYGYEESMDLMIPVVAPVGDAPRTIAVTATVDWLVCKTSCQMGRANLSADLTMEPNRKLDPVNPRAYPSKLPPGIHTTLEGSPSKGTLVIAGSAESFGATPVRFIPDSMGGVEFSYGTGPFLAKQIGKSVTLQIPFEIKLEDAVDGPPRIRGLILTGERETDPAYRIDIAAPGVPASAK